MRGNSANPWFWPNRTGDRTQCTEIPFKTRRRGSPLPTGDSNVSQNFLRSHSDFYPFDRKVKPFVKLPLAHGVIAIVNSRSSINCAHFHILSRQYLDHSSLFGALINMRPCKTGHTQYQQGDNQNPIWANEGSFKLFVAHIIFSANSATNIIIEAN
jgi:hypothetical protein